MNKILQQIIKLVERKDVKISDHGYDELAEDGIFVRDILAGLNNAIVIEDYLDYVKGPCGVGNSKGSLSTAVLVTAYRPDPVKWSSDFMRRIS